MFRSLFKSAIISSWFNSGVMMFSSFLAIPVVITKLSIEEINIFFLIGTLVSISKGLSNGFASTFMRFISYSSSGVKLSDFRNIKNKNTKDLNSRYNAQELKMVLEVMKVMYVILSVLFLFGLSLIGYFALSKPIAAIEVNQNDAWTAWYIVLIVSTCNLYLGYYNVFLMGIKKIALIQKISGLINLIGLGFILMVLFNYPNLVSIVFVYQLVSLSMALSLFFIASKELKNLNLNIGNFKFHYPVFILVWETAWKSTITNISSNIINNISGILVANYFNTAQSASFLFTQRIFNVIESFTQTTFHARLPVIASLRGKGDLLKLIPYLKQTHYLCYAVFTILYISLIIFGDTILMFISTGVELGSINLLILFSFSILLRRWSGISMGISNQANYILDYITVPISGIVFLIIIFLFQAQIGVNIYPIAQIIGIIFISPIIIIKFYPILETTFIKYEKNVIIPTFCLLAIINIIYYFV
jgi:O-antigen/teichoic acid export membrane protein